MKNFNKNSGLSIIKMVIIGLVVILVISYFGISIRGVVESPTGKDNIQYVQGGTKTVWDKYLKDPASYLWHDVWVNIFWKGFISNMERIRDGKPTDFETNAPTANFKQ